MHAVIRHRYAALKAQKGRCKYCRAPLSHSKATADHMWPRCRGGAVVRSNIVAACAPCNAAKGSLSHIEFYRLIDRRSPPSGAAIDILLIWAARRIWGCAHRACDRIKRRTTPIPPVPVASASHPNQNNETQ